MRTVHNIAECIRYVDGIVLFASHRAALVTAAPQYRRVIDDEIDITERERPCWLALDDNPDGAPCVGTDPRHGAPRWWRALLVMPPLEA